MEGKVEVEEEDMSRYWVTLRKRGYWKLKDKALVCTLRRTHFGRKYGPVERQTAK
jgi:hypothetical protein